VLLVLNLVPQLTSLHQTLQEQAPELTGPLRGKP